RIADIESGRITLGRVYIAWHAQGPDQARAETAQRHHVAVGHDAAVAAVGLNDFHGLDLAAPGHQARGAGAVAELDAGILESQRQDGRKQMIIANVVFGGVVAADKGGPMSRERGYDGDHFFGGDYAALDAEVAHPSGGLL